MAESPNRLLVCWRMVNGKKSDGIIYRLRPYDGAVEYDMELQDVLARHKARHQDHENWRGLIFRTDEETANKLDAESAIKNELNSHDIYIRDFRDELKTDAIKCFNEHNRPKQGCIDWCIEGKTIGRKTGVPKEKRQYLCMYCPAAEYYTHRERLELGLYD